MVDDNTELNPNDPSVREAREKAIEYADRVFAGEKPWEDETSDEEPADSGFDNVDEPKNDVVTDDTTSDSPDVVENPTPVEPTE